jgi:hypothetical protein
MGTLHAGGSYEDRHPVSFLFRVWRREVSSVNRESDNFLLRDLQLGPLGTTTASRARDMCVGWSPGCRTPPRGALGQISRREELELMRRPIWYVPKMALMGVHGSVGRSLRLWPSPPAG